MAGPFLSSSWYRAAAARPRLSPQVEVRLHQYRGRPWYVLSDPGTRRVHRLTPEAMSIVARMDGTATLDALWHEAAGRLGDSTPTQHQVLQLMGQLHSNELLIADAVPETRDLVERHRRERRRRWKGLLNPLSARIPLWNPDRLLEWVLPAASPLLGRSGLVAWALTVAAAGVVAWQNWTELTSDVGDRILAAYNLLLLAVCLPLLKALHELGHGLVAKRFGGDVPETGVMFLMMLPMPYVDVSSAAGFRSRRRRILVGAAGMLVETAVAAVATVVWALVEPGLVRAIAFNVVVAASVTTVLFNANPLMRYDGYYMLADALDLPNLAQRATRHWSFLIERHVFRRPGLEAPTTTAGERAWFLLYAPASLAYRLSVSFGIALFLAGHYWALGVGLALWTLFGSVLVPVWRAVRHVVAAPALQEVRGRAVGISAAAALAAAGLVTLVPLPHHSMVEGVLWLPDTASVRAGADGFVTRLLTEPGQAVAAGTSVAASEDPALFAQVAGLRGRVAELEAQFQSEAFVKRVDALVTATELAQARTELAQREDRVARLVARAGADGQLAVIRPADLVGRFLKEGELIGYVLPEGGARVARAAVDQDDLDLIRHHLSRAELQVVGHPELVFSTRIVREVPSGRDALPSKALGTAGGGSMAVDPRDTKGLRTMRRSFQIDIDLPAAAAGDAFGTRVLIRLDHDWEPLGDQLYRRVRQLLLSRLSA